MTQTYFSFIEKYIVVQQILITRKVSLRDRRWFHAEKIMGIYLSYGKTAVSAKTNTAANLL